MPLRDHFRPPVTLRHSWDELHGGWPMKIVESLLPNLPPDYVAAPHIHLRGESHLAGPDEYQVRVYDTARGRRLVAVVELVSPSTTDLPGSRDAVLARCATLLREQSSLTMVDVVTVHESNLYTDLLTSFGQSDPEAAAQTANIYAVTGRLIQRRGKKVLESWYRPLVVGQALPTLPVWLANDVAIPLDLEASYQETCRVLRIA